MWNGPLVWVTVVKRGEKPENDFDGELIDGHHRLMQGVVALGFTGNTVSCKTKNLVNHCTHNHEPCVSRTWRQNLLLYPPI